MSRRKTFTWEHSDKDPNLVPQYRGDWVEVTYETADIVRMPDKTLWIAMRPTATMPTIDTTWEQVTAPHTTQRRYYVELLQDYHMTSKGEKLIPQFMGLYAPVSYKKGSVIIGEGNTLWIAVQDLTEPSEPPHGAWEVFLGTAERLPDIINTSYKDDTPPVVVPPVPNPQPNPDPVPPPQPPETPPSNKFTDEMKEKAIAKTQQELQHILSYTTEVQVSERQDFPVTPLPVGLIKSIRLTSHQEYSPRLKLRVRGLTQVTHEFNEQHEVEVNYYTTQRAEGVSQPIHIIVPSDVKRELKGQSITVEIEYQPYFIETSLGFAVHIPSHVGVGHTLSPSTESFGYLINEREQLDVYVAEAVEPVSYTIQEKSGTAQQGEWLSFPAGSNPNLGNVFQLKHTGSRHNYGTTLYVVSETMWGQL